MMIGVEIGPSHPRRMRHPAEDRMLRPLGISRACRHSFEQHGQLRDVASKLAWTRALTSLIDLRARFDARRPLQRKVQRRPFHKGSVEPACCRADALFGQRHAAGIAQMTDHLMRRHLSPSTSAVWAHGSQSSKNLRPAVIACERLHRLAGRRVAASFMRRSAGRRRPDGTRRAHAAGRLLHF